MVEQHESPGPGPDPDSVAGAGTEQLDNEQGGRRLKGTPVSRGLVLGTVHRKDYDLSRAHQRRVPLDQIEAELNRFHRALQDSRSQLEELKQKLEGRVPVDHARILDTHVAYLKDSVFLSDVENLILNEQMALEAAIAKVIVDFDRIFRLVENETLRERAVDLRDVGIRVLRNLERALDPGLEDAEPKTPADYILVARELSIVDMFNLSNEGVRGIVTESGGLTSHAALMARSMRIPTLTGVSGLLDSIREGDFVILDAGEGVVYVEPDELVREQYLSGERGAPGDLSGAEGSCTAAATSGRTMDGAEIQATPMCGTLPEIQRAREVGFARIGLYRTELMFLIERRPPSIDALVAHYSAVLAEAGDEVTFRLLNANSSLEVPYLHEAREANPALGRSGVRCLLDRDQILRQQLSAVSRAAVDINARVAVPFVTDCSELRRVREIAFEERFALRRSEIPHREDVPIGTVIETPCAALSASSLAREADFLVVDLDSLVQYMMAADREITELECFFDPLHPAVLRVLESIVTAAHEAHCELTLFSSRIGRPAVLPLLVGAGFRRFCISSADSEELFAAVEKLDSAAARESLHLCVESASSADIGNVIDGLTRSD